MQCLWKRLSIILFLSSFFFNQTHAEEINNTKLLILDKSSSSKYELEFFKKYQFMETIRLDSKIKKDYPGIGKLINKFNPIYSTTDPKIKEIIALLSNTDSTYKDSLKHIDK